MVEIAVVMYGTLKQMYNESIQPTLLYPLMRVENKILFKNLLPTCSLKELGGFNEMIAKEMSGTTPMMNQPAWRLACIFYGGIQPCAKASENLCQGK